MRSSTSSDARCPCGGDGMTDGRTVPGTRARSELDRIRWAVEDLAVEIPSWGFVNTGTRFRVFPQTGVPRDAFEKVEDAATVARATPGSHKRSRSISPGIRSTISPAWRHSRESAGSGSEASIRTRSKTRITSSARSVTRTPPFGERRSTRSSVAARSRVRRAQTSSRSGCRTGRTTRVRTTSGRDVNG